jgi:hypothetical protein
LFVRGMRVQIAKFRGGTDKHKTLVRGTRGKER